MPFMATDQDFTFPTFPDAISSPVDSPPLWNSSPANSPHSTKASSTNEQKQQQQESNNEEEELDEYKDCFETHKKELENYNSRRKSYSWIERGLHKNDQKFDEDENMDMLWEDFNEQLRQTTSDDDNDNDKVINVGCVQLLQSPANLRLSKNGHKAVVSTRKQQHSTNSTTGFLMFTKVLKKLIFLDYNNSNSHSRSLGSNQNNYCYVGIKSRRPKNLSW